MFPSVTLGTRIVHALALAEIPTCLFFFGASFSAADTTSATLAFAEAPDRSGVPWPLIVPCD